jgi:hypothetical protein
MSGKYRDAHILLMTPTSLTCFLLIIGIKKSGNTNRKTMTKARHA